MDRLGDFDSEMVQDLARAAARKHQMKASEGASSGLVILADEQRFKNRIQIYDGSTKVFDATRWQDGDQIVSTYVPTGTWKKRLTASA